MTSVLLLLDEIPTGGDPDPESDWFRRIDESLARNPQGWTTAIARSGQLSDEHAWSLLAWIEVAATHLIRRCSRAELVTAAFAMSLVLQSGLDRRDCSIVGSLLRRASMLAELDYPSAVAEGCSRAGVFGQKAVELLLAVSAETPSTHFEAGSGETFTFTRIPPGFDVEDLERWLEGDDP